MADPHVITTLKRRYGGGNRLRGLRANYQEQAGTGKFAAVFMIQCLGRVDIHFVQMKALTMWSMDRKALAVCS
jgi:hypothetical protein